MSQSFEEQWATMVDEVVDLKHRLAVSELFVDCLLTFVAHDRPELLDQLEQQAAAYAPAAVANDEQGSTVDLMREVRARIAAARACVVRRASP